MHWESFEDYNNSLSAATRKGLTMSVTLEINCSFRKKNPLISRSGDNSVLLSMPHYVLIE